MLDKRKTHRFFDSGKARKKLDEYLENGDCYPLDVVLHLNTICNHKCDFCYNFLNLETNKGERKNSFFLDGDYTIKLISELSDCNIDKLIISGGGDPLLHKDIKKILKTAIGHDFSSFLYTNLDNDITDLIDLLIRLDGININLNTSNKELYRITRGKRANLNRVKRNLEILSKEKMNLNATVIVRDNTIHSLEETIYWLNDLGIEYINISPAFDLNYSDNFKTSKKSLEEMEKIRQNVVNRSIRILEPEEESVKDSYGNIICKTHYFDITIGADYGVYPCCAVSYLEEYKIVNLKDYNSFNEAWNSEERHKWVQQSNVKCKTCWFSPINKTLKGGCER